MAVERIAAPLVGFKAFPFKALAMPMPALLMVAAPEQKKPEIFGSASAYTQLIAAQAQRR